MRSTFGGLNTMVRGIFAQQASLDTVGHNISNANTDGYSRQNVNLSTTSPEFLYGSSGKMALGTGVSATSIVRARDTFIDRQMWKESASLGYGQAQEDTLGRIEGVFKDTSETGMQKVLNKFWNAWQTLGTNASDYGTRTALRQRGVEVADTIKHAAQQLTDVASDISAVVEIKVKKVNQINSEILSLNKQITTLEVGGNSHANDLRDRRDLLVDQLSELIKVQVNEDRHGNYSIQANGVNLVDGTSYTELDVRDDLSSPLLTQYGQSVNKIVLKETGTAVTFSGGEIKGLLDSRDDNVSGVKAYLDKLNTMSQFLLDTSSDSSGNPNGFNAIHRAGHGLDFGTTPIPPNTGNNFFGEAGFTPPANGNWISLLGVNSALFTTGANNGLDKIAAKGDPSPTSGDASGDWAVKLAEALKTTPFSSLNKSSLDGFYNSLVGALGVQSQSAQDMAENQRVLVNQIYNWRQSVAGVNMDEEMTNMIRFQKGYNASARMLTTMDEMLDKIINGMGVVGR